MLAANNIAAAGPAAPLDYLAGDAALDGFCWPVVPGTPDFVAPLRRLAPQALILFDTIELTFVSMMRAAQLQHNEPLLAQARRVQASQTQIAAAADYTLVVTPEEADSVSPTAKVHILSNVHEVIPASAPPVAAICSSSAILCIGPIATPPNTSSPTSGRRCEAFAGRRRCGWSGCPRPK